MQLSPGSNNPHIGKVGISNKITCQGYVMPEFLGGKVEVYVSVSSDAEDIKISCSGVKRQLEKEFKIDELFREILDDNGEGTGTYDNFWELRVFSEVPGEKNLVLDFRNSLGSKIWVTNTLIME